MQFAVDIVLAFGALLCGTEFWRWFKEARYTEGLYYNKNHLLSKLANKLDKQKYFYLPMEKITPLSHLYDGSYVQQMVLELKDYKQSLEKARNIWLSVFLVVLVLSFVLGSWVVVVCNLVWFSVSVVFVTEKWYRRDSEQIASILLWNMYWCYKQQSYACWVTYKSMPGSWFTFSYEAIQNL